MNEEEAFKRGEDYALNGANDTNCNFGIFSTVEFMRAWEKGRNKVLLSEERGNQK